MSEIFSIAARNVLLSHDPNHENHTIQAFLCDFGKARMAKLYDITSEREKCPQESPPEIKSGSVRKYSKATDVYMFGIMMITMISYNRFEEQLYQLPPSALVSEILPMYADGHYERVLQIIKDCLSEKPEDRPPIEVVNHQLSCVLLHHLAPKN